MVLCHTQEKLLLQQRPVMEETWQCLAETHEHPKIAGRPFHFPPKRKPEYAGIELTATLLVRDFSVIVSAITL